MAEASERGVRAPHLRAWRLYHALTQEELAEKAGTARSTLTRGEKGEPISVANARKLASAMGMSVQQLLHEKPADTKAEPAA